MINQITTVSTKGQFVIPAEMRRLLGIKPGTRVSVRVEHSCIVLEPLSGKRVNKLRGITKGGTSMADELQKERRSDKW
jgi:AbrB family looped-hinge helix DNA binding protein